MTICDRLLLCGSRLCTSSNNATRLVYLVRLSTISTTFVTKSIMHARVGRSRSGITTIKRSQEGHPGALLQTGQVGEGCVLYLGLISYNPQALSGGSTPLHWDYWPEEEVLRAELNEWLEGEDRIMTISITQNLAEVTCSSPSAAEGLRHIARLQGIPVTALPLRRPDG